MQWGESTDKSSRYEINPLQGGVIVPGLQAIITGFFLGIAAMAITAWFKCPFWAIGATVTAVASCGAWLSYRSRWQWVLEQVLKIDINNDGYIGQPAAQPTQPEWVTINLSSNNGTEGQIIPLPYADKLPLLADRVLSGRDYTQDALVGGKILKRKEYDKIKEAMLNGGLMRYINPYVQNLGIEVTPAGRAVLRHFIQNKPAPHPTAGDVG